MMQEPQLDPMGSLIVELREDDDVASLVSTRVRGFEPAPGDERGAGQYQAFVVLAALSVPPHHRVPVTFAEYGVRCYGATPQNAWAVWAAVAKAMHAIGQRVKTNGLGIYATHVIGGTQERDPDTAQPVVTGAIQLIATTQVATT